MSHNKQAKSILADFKNMLRIDFYYHGKKVAEYHPSPALSDKENEDEMFFVLEENGKLGRSWKIITQKGGEVIHEIKKRRV